VRQEGRLSPAVAAQYIRQTALGLQCAHEHNLIHRDIKPANLFLTHPAPSNSPLTTTTLPGGDRGREEGRGEGRVGGGGSLIKILDWGLATLRPTAATAEEAAPKASEHNLVGTADYLSPEQAMNPQGVDIRGDIYSLGCTLYFLLTGQTPFSGVSVMQKALQHMTAEPEPVEKLNPEVSRGLGNIVRRMMAKQPGDRFQTPAAAALALSAFCRNPLAAAVKSRNAAKTLLAVEGVRPPDDTPMSPMLD